MVIVCPRRRTVARFPCSRRLREWGAAFLAPVTNDAQVAPVPKNRSSRLRPAIRSSGLHGEQQERMTASAGPGRLIWRGQQGIDLGGSGN